jgi:hypothetical protein
LGAGAESERDLNVPRAIIRGEALANYLRSPAGSVGRMMIGLAERVQSGARAQVGKKSHNLEHSIVKRIEQSTTGILVLVGSSLSYALLHHEGTRPHEIRPVKASVLAFEINGQMVFASVVQHPGTKPNHYLTDPLNQVVASLGGL